jgi:predicted nuclease with TOPRIM domain
MSKEEARQAVHAAAERSWGPEPAGQLMSLLPTSDVATKLDLDKLRSELDGLRVQVQGLRGELHVEVGALRNEVHNEIGALRNEVQTGKHEVQMGYLRLEGQVHHLRGEFGELRGEFGELRGEFGELRGEFASLAVRVDAAVASIRPEMVKGSLLSTLTIVSIFVAVLAIAGNLGS